MPDTDEHRLTALDVLAELAKSGRSERTRLAAALELARSTRPKLAARVPKPPKPRSTPNRWAIHHAARLAAEEAGE